MLNIQKVGKGASWGVTYYDYYVWKEKSDGPMIMLHS